MARKMDRRLVALSTAAIASVFSVAYVHTELSAVQLAAADSVASSTVSATFTPSSTSSTLQRMASSTVAFAAASAIAAPYPSITLPSLPPTPVPTATPALTPTPVPTLSSTLARTTSTTASPPPLTVSQAVPTPTPMPIVRRVVPTVTPVPIVRQVVPTATVQVSRYHDGSYTGMGANRHGTVQVTVVIAGGRIVNAAIANCGMQFPCSDIAMLPGQVVARQSTAVDLVSAATLSSTAYRSAVQQALAKAVA